VGNRDELTKRKNIVTGDDKKWQKAHQTQAE
jgi:hypothetical protein